MHFAMSRKVKPNTVFSLKVRDEISENLFKKRIRCLTCQAKYTHLKFDYQTLYVQIEMRTLLNIVRRR